MSSILKALKKLEHEKSGHFPDSLKIDSDFLRSTDSFRSFSPFTFALLLLLVFGGGVVAAYFFMKETKAPLTTTIPQPVITTKSIQPSAPPQVVRTETLPDEIVVVPASREPSRKKQRKPSSAGNAVDSIVIVRKPTRAAVSGISKKPKEATEVVKSELPSSTTVPTLRVDGIAFQNSGADNMAIVNGVLVSIGSIIEGATLKEVRNDRVLFQRNGEKFEIQLGQSNR